MAQFFTTFIDLEGYTAGLANKSKIADEVEGEFKTRMEDSGVLNVSKEDSNDPQPDPGEQIEFREFSGYYETPDIAKTANIDGVGEREIIFESVELPIRGFFAVWKIASGEAFAAGGAYPAEDYEGTSESSLTSEVDDGIDLIVEVDLGIQPETIRQNIVDIAEQVKKGPKKIDDSE